MKYGKLLSRLVNILAKVSQFGFETRKCWTAGGHLLNKWIFLLLQILIRTGIVQNGSLTFIC